jgi:hypothetical protein
MVAVQPSVMEGAITLALTRSGSLSGFGCSWLGRVWPTSTDSPEAILESQRGVRPIDI